MSILIKGMEMPTNCFLCPLSVLNENRLFCEVTKNEMLRAKIDAECPLVPVPPHGRLIDADALFKEMERKGWFDNADRDKAEYLVLDAPTIIPAEE